ncbi:MAG: LemA family protein [Nitrospirae bacterium]|nr:LemA family protein [Nitrospirota bacterium]MBF0534378.1 LemA family protein [Nitrospirota bacterium]MBF0615641.1 LemA family protein [Nitrospirota bacterium]
MNDRDQINQILKKVYASELGLIEQAPNIALKNKHGLSRIYAALWSRQPAAIKTAIFALTMAVISAAVYYYNTFTINYFNVVMERAQIEAQLQRRNDLIPNLVATANKYMNYEQNVFTHVSDVRAAVKSLDKTIELKGLKADDLSVLSKFQAVAEAYPILKSSEAYTLLLKELSDTETKIVEMRIAYNKVSSYYNSRLKMFPGNIFNLVFRFKEMPVFESVVRAKTTPGVK